MLVGFLTTSVTNHLFRGLNQCSLEYILENVALQPSGLWGQKEAIFRVVGRHLGLSVWGLRAEDPADLSRRLMTVPTSLG